MAEIGSHVENDAHQLEEHGLCGRKCCADSLGHEQARLPVYKRARRRGVPRENNAIACSCKIRCSLVNADMGFNAAQNHVLSSCLLQCPCKLCRSTAAETHFGDGRQMLINIVFGADSHHNRILTKGKYMELFNTNAEKEKCDF